MTDLSNAKLSDIMINTVIVRINAQRLFGHETTYFNQTVSFPFLIKSTKDILCPVDEKE